MRDLKGEEKKEWKKAIEGVGYDFKELSENEPTMIPESKWRDYAYEEAQSVFTDLGREGNNLDCYFDFDKWSDDLQMDYNEVEVNGTTYYFRSYLIINYHNLMKNDTCEYCEMCGWHELLTEWDKFMGVCSECYKLTLEFVKQ